MDYNKLLNLGSELGRLLMHSGAEIYRVEESVTRLLAAYGVEPQVFAIPNCLIVGFDTPEGKPLTRMCRIPAHGTDIELLERCNELCRAWCAAPVPVEDALAGLPRMEGGWKQFSSRVTLLGYGMTGAFFCAFFGGTLQDFFCAGLVGVMLGVYMLYGHRLVGSNSFFRTALGAALSSVLSVILVRLGLGQHDDLITIGVLMLLVPGMALTNAMREIMAGDIISGVNRTAEVILIATAIALGTALPLMAGRLW